MPRITGIGTVRIAIAGLVCAAMSAAAAPVAQAASLDLHRAAAHGGDATSLRRTIALAERGDPRAQAMLGFMYANGNGVPQSYDLAVDWYTRSAEQGDPVGQYLLGLMYDKGFGVKADVVLAHMWLNLAAAHAPRQNRDNFVLIRDAVGSKMTRPQLEAAQQLAADFVPVRR
jgi:uncharacterized protein